VPPDLTYLPLTVPSSPAVSPPLHQIAAEAGQYVSLYTGSVANLSFYTKMGLHVTSQHDAPGATAWWFANSP